MARKYKWLGDQFVEKDILDGFKDINTREELMQMGRDEGLEGEIVRWDVWDRVVQQAKADIEALRDLCKNDKFNGGVKKPRWVYRASDGKFLGKFQDSKSVAEKFGITPASVNYYVFKEKPYHLHNLIIRDRPMASDETE